MRKKLTALMGTNAPISIHALGTSQLAAPASAYIHRSPYDAICAEMMEVLDDKMNAIPRGF